MIVDLVLAYGAVLLAAATPGLIIAAVVLAQTWREDRP